MNNSRDKYLPSMQRELNIKSLILFEVNSMPGSSVVIEKQTERVRKIFPRYKVLLHNDPINTMEYVVKTLREVVTQLSEQDAISVMLDAHNNEVGLVIVCDIEPAEFYSQALNSRGLKSSIEKEN